MEDLLVIIPIAGFALLFIGILGLSWYFAKKRREAWMAKAGELGFQFEADANYLGREYGRFKVFSIGRSRRARNVLTGEVRGFKVCLTDWSYRTGSGKNSTTHNQTVCIVSSDRLDVPHFFVRRQVPLFDFLGKVFGGQDIDFEEDPRFSKAFVLQGENEAATRRLFHPGVRERFLQHQGSTLQVEARADTLLIHRGMRIQPEKARDLIQQAIEIAEIFR